MITCFSLGEHSPLASVLTFLLGQCGTKEDVTRKKGNCSTKQGSSSAHLTLRVDPQHALFFNIYFNFLLLTAAYFIQQGEKD